MLVYQRQTTACVSCLYSSSKRCIHDAFRACIAAPNERMRFVLVYQCHTTLCWAPVRPSVSAGREFGPTPNVFPVLAHLVLTPGLEEVLARSNT